MSGDGCEVCRGPKAGSHLCDKCRDEQRTQRMDVKGYCPMGCGTTLFLGSGGYVTCSSLECPEPDAVSTILVDRETRHIVEFKSDTFTVRHPLRERLGDELMTCELDTFIAGLSGPPVQLGRYRVYESLTGWQFQPLPKDLEGTGSGLPVSP